MLRPLLFLFISLCCASLVAAEPAAQPAKDQLRLLVIGNSFSGNALRYLPDLAGAAGCKLEVVHLMVGGSPLELHWKMAAKALADAADPAGRYPNGSLPEQLDKGPWDAVTIQQYSKIADDPATYRPFADELVALIRKRAPDARIYIQETWAYRVDDPRFGAKGDLTDAEDMYRKVSAAYAGVAKDLALTIIPTGDAFHLLDSDPVWGFKIDPTWDAKTATSPTLPDQSHSLHAGWKWKDAKLEFDGHHASTAGQYLGGCVWFETFFQRSVVGNSFHPKGMSDELANTLQDAAHRAVSELAKPAAAAAAATAK